MTDLSKGQIVIYESNGNSNLEVIQEDNTLWLSAEKIAKLFGKDRTTIQRHIAKIYKEQELEENSTCAFIAQVQKEGTRQVSRNISYYNLDVILAVGYRVKSKTATKFRIWATNILKEYILKNNTMAKNQIAEEKLKMLQNTITLCSRSIEYQAKNLQSAILLAQLLDNFAHGLDFLDKYLKPLPIGRFELPTY